MESLLRNNTTEMQLYAQSALNMRNTNAYKICRNMFLCYRIIDMEVTLMVQRPYLITYFCVLYLTNIVSIKNTTQGILNN